jgi:hypothetical protein
MLAKPRSLCCTSRSSDLGIKSLGVGINGTNEGNDDPLESPNTCPDPAGGLRSLHSILVEPAEQERIDFGDMNKLHVS